MWRVGVVHHGLASNPALTGLRRGLQRRGLIEGVNCVVEAAGAEGRWAQLPTLIAQLLQRGPDVIVAIGALAALWAQRATTRVPILCAIVLDASEIGLTARNVSGVTTFDPEQATRHVLLLQQLVPGLERLVVLTDAQAPQGPDGLNPLVARFLGAAAARGLATRCVALSGLDADLGPTFDGMQQVPADALVALEVPAVLARLADIARQAEHNGLPTLTPYSWPQTGVVMQGAALPDAIDPLAEQVAALAAGACVADMPMRMLRHGRLVIHRGRAARIGLRVPKRLLEQATQVIDDEPSD